jgi:hypothetical protein
MSTEGSANLQLSWSSTTATSNSGSITTTPATSHLTLPGPTISSPRSIPRDIFGLTPDDKELLSSPPDHQTSLGTRRPHVPTDIDIRSISSHAQAEALVQRAQQDILEMEGVPDDNNPLSSGRSPLSAKLAAYGESLALERRLKRVEEGMTGEDPRSVEDDELPVSVVFTRDIGRKSGSPRVRDIRVLEAPKSMNPSRSRIRQPRRPNTSDSGMFLLFFPDCFESQYCFQLCQASLFCSRMSGLLALTTNSLTLRPQSAPITSLQKISPLSGIPLPLNLFSCLPTHLTSTQLTFRFSTALVHRILHLTISPPWIMYHYLDALLRLRLKRSQMF